MTAAGPPRIGLLGGTFDPVHRGHLAAACAVRDALALDAVLLVVANEPWQKEGTRPITPAGDRYAMVEAAAAGVDRVEASRIELDRGGVTYTIDTVEQLRAEQPGATFYLVVGEDVAAQLGTWHRADELARQVELVVVTRPGGPAATPPDGWHSTEVPMVPVPESSTGIRERIEAGLPIGDAVPAPVVRYIEEHGLYAGSG